jgi:acyl-CoA thioesterase-1
MVKIFKAIVLVLLLLASPVASAAQTILVFGDSLSAGFGLAREQSWPALLDQRLKALGSGYRVVNASISGETTAGGLARLPAALESSKPAIVILALGANDGLRGLPASVMANNLAAMIRTARQHHANVLLCGMKLPPNYGPDYTAQFARAFSDVAKRERTPFLPFLLEPIATDHDAFQADNMHPVAAAEPKILQHVWAALKPLL